MEIQKTIQPQRFIPQGMKQFMASERQLAAFIDDNYENIIRGACRSPKTAKNYISQVKPFIEFISSNTISMDLPMQYVQALDQDSSISASTKNIRINAARKLLIALYKKRFLPLNLADEFESVQQYRGHKTKGLTEEQVMRLKIYIAGIENPLHRIRYQTPALPVGISGASNIRGRWLAGVRPKGPRTMGDG
jgi:hypothetical protein